MASSTDPMPFPS
jgi:4-oxalocrotonate tautomerase